MRMVIAIVCSALLLPIWLLTWALTGGWKK